jgi:predicted Zn-dependent protease
VGDEFDSMKIFKLAESERETNHESDAIAHYQKLLGSVPNFPPAELGLAKAYLKGDAKSVDAKKCLQQVLAADPDGKEKSTIEAKQLLQQFDSSKN